MRRAPPPGSGGRRGEAFRITSPPTLLLGSLSTDIQETLRTNTERAGVRHRPPPRRPRRPSSPTTPTGCRSKPQLDARRRGEGGGAGGTRDERRSSTRREGPGPRLRPGQVGGEQKGGGPRASHNGGNRWAAGRSGRVSSGTSGRGSCELGPTDSPPTVAPAGRGLGLAAATAASQWAARPRSSSGGKQSTQTKYT